MAGETKYCKTCEVTKTVEDFAKNNQQKDGLHVYCRECTNKRGRLLYFPKKDRARQLKRKYGITIEAWDNMFDQQKGCCAICGRHQSEFKKSLHTDHNHDTGVIRQLLCTVCNHSIGIIENLEWMEKASKYLYTHSKKKEAV